MSSTITEQQCLTEKTLGIAESESQRMLNRGRKRTCKSWADEVEIDAEEPLDDWLLVASPFQDTRLDAADATVRPIPTAFLVDIHLWLLRVTSTRYYRFHVARAPRISSEDARETWKVVSVALDLVKHPRAVEDSGTRQELREMVYILCSSIDKARSQELNCRFCLFIAEDDRAYLHTLRAVAE